MTTSPGERILKLLRQLGVSQKDLAQSMGRPLQAINEIIKAKKAITPRTAIELEAALCVKAETILRWEYTFRLQLEREKAVQHDQ